MEVNERREEGSYCVLRAYSVIEPWTYHIWLNPHNNLTDGAAGIQRGEMTPPNSNSWQNQDWKPGGLIPNSELESTMRPLPEGA